jgi:hypothetical protein
MVTSEERIMMRHRWLSLTLCGAALSAAAAPGVFDVPPVPDEVLAETRGGFDSNLVVSLGLERLVTINGNLVSGIQFNVADLAHITGPEAAMVRDALAPSQLVQNGMGNAVSDPMMLSQTVSALLIQNTANDQLIRSQTTINASVNTLSALKGMNFEGSLRQALAGAVLPR